MKYIKNFNQINELVKNVTLINSYCKSIYSEILKINSDVKMDMKDGSIKKRAFFTGLKAQDSSNLKRILNKWKSSLEKEDIILSFHEPTEEWISVNQLAIYFKNKMTARVHPNRWIFHFTQESKKNDIIKNGLIPHATGDPGSATKGVNWEYPKSIFAMNNYGKAWGGGRSIFTIKTSGLKNKWWYDLNLYDSYYGTDAIMTFEPISPDNIYEISREQYREICSLPWMGFSGESLDRKVMEILKK